MADGAKTPEAGRLEAVRAVLIRRYGEHEGARIHRLATTTHKGRVDSTAYTRWVEAAKEVKNHAD